MHLWKFHMLIFDLPGSSFPYHIHLYHIIFYLVFLEYLCVLIHIHGGPSSLVLYVIPWDKVSHWTWDTQQILRLNWQVVMAMPCLLCGYWRSKPRTSCLSNVCCYPPKHVPILFLPYFWWWWVFHFIDAWNRNKWHKGHDSAAVPLLQGNNLWPWLICRALLSSTKAL